MYKVLIYPYTFGVFPLNVVTVNYSSGYNMTKLGPNTILDSFDL